MALGEPAVNVIDSADRFDAAIEAFRKRVPITKSEWDGLSALERENALTASKVTNARVLQDVLDAIDRAVEDGTDFAQFKDDVAVQLIESWGGEIPGRIENVFRTNLATSYNEGRHAIYSSPTVRQARPYLRCDGTEDDRQCEICARLQGVIRPQDEWASTSPPFHYGGCRCQLTPLSQEEAEDEGIDDELPDVDIDDDFGAEPSRKGEDWDFDLSGLDPELRAQVEKSIDEEE
jgi:hypothetical protein